MIRSVTDCIENSLSLAENRPYGAILGLAPSKGARSPVLWRAAFSVLKIEADFHPFDVMETNLIDLVAALREDTRFVGGAIAVPYKETIIEFLDETDPVAEHIGAVNALYRMPDGGIGGTNTDGAAARDCLIQRIGELTGKRIALLGLGGAGKAAAAFLAEAGGILSVWNRDTGKAVNFAAQACTAGWAVETVNEPDTLMERADVLVNCTSVGFSADGAENSDMPVPAECLKRLAPTALVYDIIYQPPQTALLRAAEKQALKTMNGLCMNQKQAVLAFCRAFPDVEPDAVGKAMSDA